MKFLKRLLSPEPPKPSQIVVMDSKNTTAGVIDALKRLEPNLANILHVFVRQRDGSFAHNLAFKGDHYNSTSEHLNEEIKQIAQFHSKTPVAAVVIPISLYLDDQDAIKSRIQKIQQIDPAIKVILHGIDGASWALDGHDSKSAYMRGDTVIQGDLPDGVDYATWDGSNHKALAQLLNSLVITNQRAI